MDKDIRELSGILDSLGVDESAELVSGLNIVNYLGHADGLQLQRQVIAAVMLAALALGSGFPAGEAQASNKMASMQVSAVVRASAQLQTERSESVV